MKCSSILRTIRLNLNQGPMIIALAATVGLMTACAHGYKTVYPAPPQDSTTAFCQSEFIGQNTPLPAEEQATLDDEDRLRDERTIELMLKRAALEIAAASESSESCIQTIRSGEALFLQSLARSRERLGDAGGFDPATDAEIVAVQEQITDWWRRDQSARTTLIGFPVTHSRNAAHWANRLATAHAIRTDQGSTAYLETLLQSYDWIDQPRFGVPVSAHAWILIQHADQRVDLQAEVLNRMQPYFENGGIRPANYAYLWDRVAVNRNQPQRYGTQPIWECEEGRLALAPIEDRALADQRRRELGMKTVQQQLDDMSRSVCGGH